MEIGQQQVELFGGKLILYTRADDSNGIWQCRMRLGAERRLVRRSTRTTDLAEAKRTAEELYDELRFKQRNGQQLKSTSFKTVADDFVRAAERNCAERRLSNGRLTLIEGTLRRYLLPYFGNRPIAGITQADFNGYDEWRLGYWNEGAGAERRAANAAEIPSAKTLVMEQSILRQVFKHAVENGVIERMPYMAAKRARTNRRSAFSVKEYGRLIRAARNGVLTAKHQRVRRDRALLALYVRLLAQTGLRIGEARGLRWSDVELITVANSGVEAVRLWVDGKTGKRAVIGTTATKRTLRQLLSFYGYGDMAAAQLSGRWLFENEAGERIHTFEVGFKALVKRCGLAMDRYGSNRTLYCLRHTYATFRLLYGKVDVYLLARNMGTSVAMIEQHYGHVRTTLAAERLI